MRISIILSMLLFSFISFAQDAKIQAVDKMVSLYQDEAEQLTGNEVKVIYDPAPLFRADAKIFDTGPVIRIFSQLEKQMTSLELVMIACHEMGHILGDVREANNLLDGSLRHFREAVEGEADYFGGRCLKKYLEETGKYHSENFAEKVAAKAYQKLHQSPEPINEALALNTTITGILPAYPTPECRLLTVLNGMKGKERPKCWYNP